MSNPIISDYPISPELAEALALIEEKRKEARQARIEAGLPVDRFASGERITLPPEPAPPDGSSPLPFSVAQQLVERHFEPTIESDVAPPIRLPLSLLLRNEDEPAESAPTINIFGHLLDRLQQNGQVGEGRVWLLLRFLDREKGEGRVPLDRLREMLTGRESPYRCLSRKRLRQILNKGEGTFWHRDEAQEYVYYHSEVRLAVACGLTQIGGWAVSIPVLELCQPIKAVRALFYDAFHSARGDGFQNPITRHTLEDRGNGDRRTQRNYEKIRGMEKQPQFQNLGLYTRLAWRQAQAADDDSAGERIGGPAFVLVDYKGLLGKNNKRHYRAKKQRHWHNIYIMRQIGNAYQGTLRTIKRGRKWTNRKLQNLYNSMLSTGSIAMKELSNADENIVSRMYFDNEDAAQKAMRRDQPRPVLLSGGVIPGAHFGYWQEMEAE